VRQAREKFFAAARVFTVAEQFQLALTPPVARGAVVASPAASTSTTSSNRPAPADDHIVLMHART